MPKSANACENQLVLGSELLKKVYTPFKYPIGDFAYCKVSQWAMMINKSFNLIFVLLCKSMYLWSHSKSRIVFWKRFVVFNEFSKVPSFVFYEFLESTFSVIRENRDCFTIILGLFQLFVGPNYETFYGLCSCTSLGELDPKTVSTKFAAYLI